MPVLEVDEDSFFLDKESARLAGEQLGSAYQKMDPYPHGSYDNFLPEKILRRVLEECRDLKAQTSESSFDRPQERLKQSFNPDSLPAYTRSLFYSLNARPFISFVEALTGIKGLIPDPFFSGAGIHRVANGGHLDVHADFNHLSRLNVERRVNVLIYLNEDWKEEYGGQFEIWENDMGSKAAVFSPIFNRMCCFNTSSTSWHGNPAPVNHPDGQPRLSIALYYYTATWQDGRRSHTTLFKPRPDSDDKTDWQIARREFASEWLPPVIYRRLRRFM
jgi:Rps23 Pro-64 3,4-dihydroxylase Tpa1-like proline 4-hydroxylase